jgi:hypothetical protein
MVAGAGLVIVRGLTRVVPITVALVIWLVVVLPRDERELHVMLMGGLRGVLDAVDDADGRRRREHDRERHAERRDP